MKLTLIFLSFLIQCWAAQKLAPIIEIESGKISGIIEQSFSGQEYFSYLGIPFAEPPTGNLRFKAPIPVKPWDGIKDGSKDGSPCLQIAQFNEPNLIGSEDCLWLNVYAPTKKPTEEKKLKPVLVWIYGGRFLVGTASSKIYSPHFMMDQDLVMVSIQWRVGPYGFLSTESQEAPGNYGFQDQVLALKWIQANIHKFGGDAKQVTVSGHSAGSASAHLHTISPLSKGLLSQAISLSGTAANFWAGRATSHAKYAKQMGQLFECPTETNQGLIQCLRQVDPRELTQAQWKLHDFFHASPAKLPLSTFLPRIDAEAEHPFMPVSPLELVRNGTSRLTWMTGITSQEGAWYTSSLYGQDSMEYLKEYQVKRIEATKSLLAGMVEKDEDIERILEFYTQNKPVDDQKMRVPMSQLASDLIFNVEGLLGVHLVSKFDTPVYLYQFNFRGNWSFAYEFEETQHDYEGVAHLDDISYYMRVPFHTTLSKEEVEVMKLFTNFIANFVRTGVPSENWPSFKIGKGVSMVIDNPPKLSYQMPFESRMKFLMDLLGHPEDLQSDYQESHDEL